MLLHVSLQRSKVVLQMHLFIPPQFKLELRLILT